MARCGADYGSGDLSLRQAGSPCRDFFGAYFKPYEGESEPVLMGRTDDITDVSATAFPVRV